MGVAGPRSWTEAAVRRRPGRRAMPQGGTDSGSGPGTSPIGSSTGAPLGASLASRILGRQHGRGLGRVLDEVRGRPGPAAGDRREQGPAGRTRQASARTASPQSGQTIVRAGIGHLECRSARDRAWLQPARPSLGIPVPRTAAGRPRTSGARAAPRRRSRPRGARRRRRPRAPARRPTARRNDEHQGGPEDVAVDERGPQSGPGHRRGSAGRDEDEEQDRGRDAEQHERLQRVPDGLRDRADEAAGRSRRHRGRSAVRRSRR